MNILIITRYLFREAVGGSRRDLWNFAQTMASFGHNVHIVCFTKESALPGYERKSGIHIHRFIERTKNPFLSYVQRTMKTLEAYLELNKNNPFDIINIHGSGMVTPLISAAKCRKVPIVYTFHASLPYELKFNFYKKLKANVNLFAKLMSLIEFPLYYYRYKISEKKASSLADAVLVHSEYIKRQIEYLYGKKWLSKINIIPIGVDLKKFSPPINKLMVRRKLRLPTEKKIFFTLRNLKPRMGLENLVLAMRKVIEKHKNTILLIGGKGELKKRLETLIQQQSLEGYIRLLGFIDDDLLPFYYQAVDAFIVPTEELEGFGIVTIEALASNLPVLGTPAGATPEILSPINKNLIAKDTSPDAIADTIFYFINNFNSLTSNKVYRKAALERYNWDVIGRRMEIFLKQLIDSKKR